LQTYRKKMYMENNRAEVPELLLLLLLIIIIRLLTFPTVELWQT